MSEQFGKYKILEKLGSGGMATAYRAELAAAEGVRKRLVLKVIHTHLAEKKSFVEMFIAEAKLVATLTHGNLAQVFDFGKVDNRYYIAMEEVVGKPLSKVLKAAREAGYVRMPVPLALQIAIGVLDGLYHAHSRRNEKGEALNLVHRDVTPDNVLLSFEGEIKVVDFGIAKTIESEERTEMGSVRGKYPYMSPEQAGGRRDLDARTDLWAVGVLLYELLSGRRPYEGEWQMVMREVTSAAPVLPLRSLLPSIDPTLEAIVMAALEKPREKRPATARDFSHALTSYLHQHHPHSTRQEIQFLLALLFPGDITREGADITVPPNFASQLMSASTGGGEHKPGPPVPSNQLNPAQTRERPKIVDDEATVNSLSGAEEDDEATVAGLPAEKKEKRAETLAEILAAVRPGGIRPPANSKEVAPPPEVTAELPKPEKKKSTNVSIKKPIPRTNTRGSLVSHEVSLKKDIGQAPRRQSIAVAVGSLAVGVLALAAFVAVRSMKDSDVPPPAAPPSVWITSSPPSANFSIDGSPIGKTPFSANLTPGQHSVMMEMIGYAPYERTFSVQPGENLTITGNLELIGTGDGGALAELDRAEPAWPVANDADHSAKTMRRFHTLSLSKAAMPLNQYKPLRIELSSKQAYQITTQGAVSLGRGRSTSHLIYFLDMEGHSPGQMGLLGPTPRTIRGAKAIRIFAFDDDLSDNSGTMGIEVRVSNYVPPQSYAFDAKKHVLVPRPEHQYRIEGMEPKNQYLIFSRLDQPRLNKNWQGQASKILCLTHSKRVQSLASAARFIPLGGKVILEGAAGLSCFFLDDLTEDNSGSVELDIVGGDKVSEEGINPKQYTPMGRW